MSAEVRCSSEECGEEAVTAIRTWIPGYGNKGIRSTIYQFPEEAPKNAPRYCVWHAALVSIGLVALSDVDAKRLVLGVRE